MKLWVWNNCKRWETIQSFLKTWKDSNNNQVLKVKKIVTRQSNKAVEMVRK